MASTMDKLAKELKAEMTASDERKPKPYDTQAEVVRVEDGTAWVHIPGGVDETPVRLTINARKGDTVNVHVADGTAWITGNSTNPPTDDRTANNAINISTQVQKDVIVLNTVVTENIEATNARFTNVEADTAKIHSLTADQLSASVGYIEDLTAEEITVQDLTAASGYIKDLEADNITAQDISADHATIGSLDTNYAHITNGVIDNAKIGYADVNGLSANYAKIADLNAAEGRIDNLEANEVVVHDTLEAANANIEYLKSDWISTDRLVLTGNNKNNYPPVEITESEFNTNKTAYWTKNGNTYTQCTASSVYDPDEQYYVRQTVKSIIEAINTANNTDPQVVVSNDKLIAASMDVAELSAITADMGELTAGKIQKGNNFINLNTSPASMEFKNASTWANATQGIQFDTQGKLNIKGTVNITGGNVPTNEQMNDAIEGIEVGGRNMLIDSDTPSIKKVHASTNRYWSNTSAADYTATFEQGSGLPVNCKYAARLSQTGSFDKDHILTWYSGAGVPLVRGEQYTMSVWCKKVSGTNLKMMFEIGVTSYIDNTSSLLPLIDDNEWHRYSWTFTAPIGDNYYYANTSNSRIYVGGIKNASAAFEVLYCGYKLEKGNKATDWTPAPEDVQGEIDGIDVGGRNLLLDSEAMSSWYTASGASISGGVATLVGSSSDWNSCLSTKKYDASLYDGTTTYTWSFEYKSSVACVLTPVIAGTNQSIDSSSWSRTKYIGWTSAFTLPSSGGVWTKYTLNPRTIALSDLTSGSGDVVNGYLQLYCRTNNANLQVRHLKLEKGNKATDWTPAPEDMMSGSTFIAYRGTSSTGTSTAAKEVTCKGFVLELGATVSVYFNSSNAYVGTLTLNVNDTGAKDVYIGSEITSDTNRIMWHYGTTITFTYDGAKWCVVDAPGAFYGTTCSTAAGTAKKATTIPSSAIFKGCTIEVPMTYANTASSPELSINNSANNASNLVGSILYGTSSTAPTQSNGYSWLANMSVIFKYDGKYWRTGNQTILDGGNILTGTIAADRIKANVISAVNGGTGTINGDKINASQINIGSLAGSIGGRNLLGNTKNPFVPDGGNSGAGMTFGNIGRYNSPASEFSIEKYDDSSNSMIVTSSVTGNRGLGWYTKAGAVVAGETYTFSCRVKTSVAATVHTHTAWRNGSATAGYTGWTAGGNLSVSANTWTDYSYTFTPSSDAQLTWEFMVSLCFTGATTGITCRIAHAKFEKGNKATDWTPAPEDVQAEIDATNGNILLDSDAPTLTKVKAATDRYWSDVSQTTITCSNFTLTDAPEQGLLYGRRFVCNGTNTSATQRAYAFYSGDDNYIPLLPNKTYTATVWARCTSGSGTLLINTSKGDGATGTVTSPAFTLTSYWKKFSYSFTYGSTLNTNYNRIWFYGKFPANTSGTIEICGCKLVASDNAESYITRIDNNGIRIHPASNENNYVTIKGDGMYIYQGGTERAYFKSDAAAIGTTGQNRAIMNSSGFTVYRYINSSQVNVANLTDSSCRVGINANNYGHTTVKPDGLHVWTGVESTASNEVAKFGATATVGKTATGHIEIDDGGLQVFDTDGSTSIATFGATARIGADSSSHLFLASDSIKAIDSIGNEYFEVAEKGGTSSGASRWTKSGVSNTAYTIDLSTWPEWSNIASGATFYIQNDYYCTVPGIHNKTYKYNTVKDTYKKGTTKTSNSYSSYTSPNTAVSKATYPTLPAGSTFTSKTITIQVTTSVTKPLYRFGEDVSESGGAYSFLMGNGTTSNGQYQLAVGRYNTTWANAVLMVGWGTADNARKTVFSVDRSGNVDIANGAKYKVNGTGIDDFVVETGLEDNKGQYRKWKSGIAECWIYTTKSVAINNAYGSLYQGTWTWTFPTGVGFIAEPTVTCSHFKWGTGASWGTVSASTTTNATLRGIDAVSRASGSCVIAAYAIGSWT